MTKSSVPFMRGSFILISACCAAAVEGCARDKPADEVRPDEVKKKPNPTDPSGKEKTIAKLPLKEPKSHRVLVKSCARGSKSTAPTISETRETYKPRALPPKGPACTSDLDCATSSKTGIAAKSARCVSAFCVYDACVEATDCPGKTSCRCDDYYGHACMVAGDCRLDADCGPKGFCSPSLAESCPNMGGIVGLFCRTEKDECVEHEDCAKGPDKLDGMCVFHTSAKKWACAYGMCVGSNVPKSTDWN